MPVYALGDRVPSIHESAFVHPDAVLIGDVTVGAHSSVWPCAVLRGDAGRIVVGDATSIQDGAVVHCTSTFPTRIGSWVVVGHLAHLEGCTVEDRALIGVSSVVLHEAHVETGATVGGGAVVTNRMRVPANALAVGVPAQIKVDRSSAEQIEGMAQHYVDNTARFRRDLRRLS